MEDKKCFLNIIIHKTDSKSKSRLGLRALRRLWGVSQNDSHSPNTPETVTKAANIEKYMWYNFIEESILELTFSIQMN